MLAFIGYAWSRILCATAAIRLRTVVCVPGPVSFRTSATTAVLVHVHPAANAYPKGNFLSDGRGSDPWYHELIPLPRVPLVRVPASFFLQLPVCLI